MRNIIGAIGILTFNAGVFIAPVVVIAGAVAFAPLALVAFRSLVS